MGKVSLFSGVLSTGSSHKQWPCHVNVEICLLTECVRKELDILSTNNCQIADKTT